MPSDVDIEAQLGRMVAKQPRGLIGLYDLIGPTVFGMCMIVSRHEGEAAQHLRMIFGRLWAGVERFPATQLSGKAWVMSVVRGVLHDPLSDIWPDGVSRDLASDAGGVGISDLTRALYLRGWSYGDMAVHLDMTEDALRDWVVWRDMTLDGDDAPMETARAAEYVLGTLDIDASRAFRATVSRDIAVGATFVFWSERFATIFDDVAPVSPPGDMRDGIALIAGKNRTKAAKRRDIATRTMAFAACAIFVIGAAYTYFRTDTVVPYVADLTGPEVEHWGEVTFDAGRQEFVIRIDKDRDIQDGVALWVMSPDGGIHPIGALSGVMTARFTAPPSVIPDMWGNQLILRRHTPNKNARGAFLARGRFARPSDENGASDLLDQLFLAFKAAAVLDLVPRPNDFL